ncbi:acyltransferase [Streptomyces sp. NPDC002734]|uniref:acyltransferase family protein n=1 Tax=Streptomyces sp. NPDC002734 TaxID=3154426 RepID=UPI003316946D
MTSPPRRERGAAGGPGALDRLVDATPDRRDRVVDAARVLSIVIVTLWHWTLSVTHRTADGSLVMPNPVDAIPGGWLLTWVLQIMPVFFLVGGYANLAGWESHRRAGGSAGRFVADRLRRLSVPTAVWAGVWLVGELVAAALPGPHRWMWQWFPGYLTPLWFLAVYSLLIVAVPVTATLHARHPAGALAAPAALIALGSVLGRGLDLAWAEWVTLALVWLFCHQLGYVWRTWRLGRRPTAQRLAVTGTGLLALVVLTMFAGYPRSMVGAVGDAESNIFPTTAAIAALAVFQLGLLALVTPAATRLLRRRAVWKPVVAVNAVAITVFLWHMTAWLAALWVWERLGHTLLPEPTAAWWAQRWYWLLGPLIALLPLIAVFAPVEIRTRGSSRKSGRRR